MKKKSRKYKRIIQNLYKVVTIFIILFVMTFNMTITAYAGDDEYIADQKEVTDTEEDNGQYTEELDNIQTTYELSNEVSDTSSDESVYDEYECDEVIDTVCEAIDESEDIEDIIIASDSKEDLATGEDLIDLEDFDKGGLIDWDVQIEYLGEYDDISYDSMNYNVCLTSSYYDDVWEQYGTWYYYNQLDEDYRRTWDELNVACSKVLNSNAYFEHTDDVKVYGLYDEMSDELQAEIQSLVLRFYNSNPQYYFIMHGYSIRVLKYSNRYEYYISFQLYEDFRNGASRALATAEFKDSIDTIIAKVDSTCETDIERLDTIQREICYLTTYNNDAAKRLVDEEDSKSQSAYSLFVMHNSVCSGYAHAVSLLCNYYGIDSIYVSSASHAWNLVKYNDNWYFVDATWADTDSIDNKVRYLFFMRSYDKYMTINDSSRVSHTLNAFQIPYLPKTSLDTGSDGYSISNTKIPSISDRVQIEYEWEEIGGKYTIVPIADKTDVTIYYTTDGYTVPDEASTRCYQYKGEALEFDSVDDAERLRFIAVCDGYLDSEVCYVQEPNESLARIGGYRLSVAGDISINFYVDLAKSLDKSAVYMEYSYSDGKRDRIYASDAEVCDVDGKAYYVFKCKVSAKQMTDSIDYEFYIGDEYDIISGTYSVREYADYILNSSDYSDNVKALVRSILLYGGSSQEYFGYNMDQLASSNIVDVNSAKSYKDVGRDLLKYNYNSVTNYGQSDISFYGANLVLGTTTDMNIYFSMSDTDSIENYRFLYKDKELIPSFSAESGRYYVQIKDIYAYNLDSKYEVEVIDKDSYSYVLSVKYSPMAYIKNVMFISDDRYDSLKKVCRDMYYMNYYAKKVCG